LGAHRLSRQDDLTPKRGKAGAATSVRGLRLRSCRSFKLWRCRQLECVSVIALAVAHSALTRDACAPLFRCIAMGLAVARIKEMGTQVLSQVRGGSVHPRPLVALPASPANPRLPFSAAPAVGRAVGPDSVCQTRKLGGGACAAAQTQVPAWALRECPSYEDR
jgi:hypothetical protein